MGAVATAEKKWQGMNWIRQEKRLALYWRDSLTCLYCGTDLRNAGPSEVQLDHLQPRSLGGGNEASNLVTACRPCNASRGARDWKEFAPGGAIERIEYQRHLPLNVKLAKAVINGTAGDPELEALR